MSKFLSKSFDNLVEYVPGEQPRGIKIIKLNTNESPFPPSKNVIEATTKAVESANLYCDTDCTLLRQKAAEIWNVKSSQILAFNGSDEVLSFLFNAYKDNGVCYPEISYGFYSVYADYYGIEKTEIPLKDDLSIDYKDYINRNKTIFIANPNAPTGLVLSKDEIEQIVKSNKNNVVVIDEAYVEFGAESVITLLDKYENLAITRTFSKSHSLAGGRIGFLIANEDIIKDINKLKYSFNPYNVNSMSQAAGLFALIDEEYYKNNCKIIQENREYTMAKLKDLGFVMTNSKSNFIFAKKDGFVGKELLEKLRSKGVLVRNFKTPQIKDYLRITVGTKEQMDTLIEKLKEILGE